MILIVLNSSVFVPLSEHLGLELVLNLKKVLANHTPSWTKEPLVKYTMKIEELEKRIKLIEIRNKKVETDKAWETSLTRKILLISFTFLSIGLYMNAIGVNNPWLNAVIPSLGFLLSTLSLPYFKKTWTNKQRKLLN